MDASLRGTRLSLKASFAALICALVAALAFSPSASPKNIDEVRTVFGPESVVAPGTSLDVFAVCAEDERLLGGGYVQPFNIIGTRCRS